MEEPPGCRRRGGAAGALPPLLSAEGLCLSHTRLPQLFITVMDKLRLEIRAMDEVGLPPGPGRGSAGRGGASFSQLGFRRSSRTCGS